jgi:hypothetical protein
VSQELHLYEVSIRAVLERVSQGCISPKSAQEARGGGDATYGSYIAVGSNVVQAGAACVHPVLAIEPLQYRRQAFGGKIRSHL